MTSYAKLTTDLFQEDASSAAAHALFPLALAVSAKLPLSLLSLTFSLFRIHQLTNLEGETRLLSILLSTYLIGVENVV